MKEKDIQKVFMDYFSGLFTTKSNLDMEEALGVVEHRFTDEMRERLSLPFSKEEVTEALFQMHPCKAPEPDGMSAIFFQRFWSSVGHGVINVVLGVQNCGASLVSLNHTFIALIPKVRKSKCPAEFRPIRLCNVVFKVITKVIANKLKVFLLSVVDLAQSAFVLGRLITDNALLAYEIVHSMKHNKAVSKGSSAFKLDK